MEKDNKPNAITLRIVKEEYYHDGKTTICRIRVKTNIKEFERKYFTFTPSFIKHTVGEYLPTIQTIYNYRDKEMECAKFYHIPGSKVKVLHFYTNYYQRFRNYPDEMCLKDGDMVLPSQVPGVNTKIGECSTIDYCDSFTVQAQTTCADEDVYDKIIGENVALSKAMMKATTRIINLSTALHCHLTVSGEHVGSVILEMLALRHNIDTVGERFTNLIQKNDETPKSE